MPLPKFLSTFLKESPVILGMRLVVELFDEWTQLMFNLGAARCRGTKAKIEAKLTVEYHAIEKGLSLGAPRLGFGEKRILTLVSDLRWYHSVFNDRAFLERPLATIRGYISFNQERGFEPTSIRKAYDDFLDDIGPSTEPAAQGGVKLVKRSDIQGFGAQFEAFANTRHSLRNYSDAPVTREEILAAIRIAQRSPSACNRQSWHSYVFMGAEKDALLGFQGGTNGFTESVGAAIVVVGDLRNFFINEIHQPYIDGSLFAMSMMFAFHAQGMGSIPLTTSFKRRKLREFKRRFGIPDYHTPVMIIGVGHLKEEFHVAWSARKDVSDAVTFRSEETRP
ncbi:MAG: nitroreductase family protein [Fibrobacteria bacterium]|nr:nitroreductase family protein [Fibrobacteria bacterium]